MSVFIERRHKAERGSISGPLKNGRLLSGRRSQGGHQGGAVLTEQQRGEWSQRELAKRLEASRWTIQQVDG